MTGRFPLSISRSLYAVARPSFSQLQLKLFAVFLCHLVPWPSTDILRRSSQGTPPLGAGAVKRNYSDFGPIEGYIWETVGGKLVLTTNRKLCMCFRLVPKLVTLNDLKRRNGA